MSWLFGICDELTFGRGENVPVEWGYRPSIAGPSGDDENGVVEILRGMVIKDVLKLGEILHRYSNILDKHGKSY